MCYFLLNGELLHGFLGYWNVSIVAVIAIQKGVIRTNFYRFLLHVFALPCKLLVAVHHRPPIAWLRQPHHVYRLDLRCDYINTGPNVGRNSVSLLTFQPLQVFVVYFGVRHSGKEAVGSFKTLGDW